ncbi:amino acid adenylation domain-containing protein [Paenibacillus taichungensis]|uniref:amino acid adenylation domain-containing protein n=1 Tax=Paenibacillus taichungensis TaxID=484184 RepID=UPI0038D1A9F4
MSLKYPGFGKHNVDESQSILGDQFKGRQISDEIESRIELSSRISLAKVCSDYPINTAQKRMLLQHETYPNLRIYNVPLYYELNQPLDVEKFEHCINELIVKHEILRTSFVMINSQPVQVVHQDLRIAVKRSVIVGQHKREHFQEFIEVFDISAVPLFRVEYVEVDGSEFYILFDFHHIMMDGLSIQHFLNDLMQLYRFNTVATPSLQYKDYSMWLSTDEVQESISRQSSYWLNQFEGDIPLLELPTDKQRPALQSFEGHTIHFEVEEKLEKAVRTYASQSRSTLFTTLFSIFTVLLSKYTRQEDIVIGTTVSGRNHPDVDTMVGMFVNTLAIRTSPTKEKTMEDYLQEMNDQLIQSYANQDYPFEELVDQLHIQRDLSRNPLYNVMFSMSNVALQEHTTEGLILKPITAEYPFSKVDVTLAIHETDDKLSFSIEYATALYEADTIQRMGNHYIQLIQNVILSPARTRLKELKMITAAEEENLVFHYNDTAAPYSHHKLMHQLFEEKVLKIPQSIAVEGEFGQLTYQALNEQANQLAHLLRSRHETDSPYVAIMLDRGPDMIISVLGTLKAGFTYIPLDPKWPMERISYIVSSLAVKHMITEPHYVDSMSHVDMKSIICLTPASALGDHENLVDSKDIHPYSKVNPAPNQDTDSIAYVIFTSGSTGQPKGVEVKHKPVINLMEWMNSRFNINEGDKLLFVTSLCFDLSVYDIFGTLAAGGCIRIAVEHEVRDPDQLMNIIFNEGITVWDSAPAALQQLTSYFPEHPIPSHLRLVFLSGDWIPITLPTQLKTVFEQVQVISLGGATEATIWSNYYPVNEVKPQWKSIPYGKPIQNARYYILDSELHPCPTGVPGELYIGGECLATGYIQAPELTSERFVMDPFLKSSSHIMYRTGDLARWMKDGNMEFLGRIDHQVKIRGYRIELGEIEYHLLKHPMVKEAITMAKKDETGSNYLCAYYTTSQSNLDKELKSHLINKLPEYMVPSVFVEMEHFPVTVNGKLNRGALPEPKRVSDSGNYREPTTEMGREIASIWEEVLKVEHIGTADNFYSLGGDSLKAARLASTLKKKMEIAISIKDILKHPSIEGLEKVIAKQLNKFSDYSLIEKAGEAPYYMAAPSQQNMYTLCNVVQGTHYNTPLLYEMLGEVNEEQLLYGLELLVRRHEALRTTFELKDHKVIQRIHEMLPIDFKKVDTDRPAEEVAKQCITSFSLEEGPLFKVRFIKHTGTKRQYLFTDFHHIVCDGITITILMNDLFSLLNGDRLEEIPLQYRDYSEWQNQQLNTNELNWHKEYYINLFQDGVPKTTLKTDFPRPLYPTFQGKTIPYTLSSSLTAKLKKVATETGTTLFMVLLATYNIFLAKHSHEEDLVVGTPFTGRNHPDSHEIAGMFVNTLPIRSQPRRDKGFKEYLFEVKELVFSGMEHSDYQFEQLVNDLNVTRDLSHNPLFDTMFTMQNFEVRSFNNARLEAQKMNFYGDTAHFDLLVYAYETQQEIQLEWEYSTDLFQENTIHRYISQFEKLLTEITDRLDSRISELQLLTTEEKNKVLYAFNNTAVGYDNEKSLLDVFSELVQSKPHITILKQDNQEITLEQLDELSNTVANYLLQRGVKEEQSIGIMMGNDVAMVVSALGIIKAGAAYVPLDFESPVQRINYIIEDCQLVYIFTNLTDMNPSISAETIQYQDILNSNASSAKVFPGRAPDSLACIMYTSGSTGQPKGVLVEDHNIISLVRDVEYIDFAAYQTLLMTGSFSFDASTFEIWGSLLNGLTLVLVDKSKLLDITEFSRVLAEYQVDLMWLTSPWFNQIISEDPSIFSHVQTLIVGGDLLSSVHIQSALKNNPQLQILNGYGPTENTTFSTIFAIDRNDVQQNIPIGKPITNSTGYVVDLHTQELLPIGQIGELWVGGEGVTRGYLNQTELTNTKYITNPFTGEGRVYKTGDLVSWNDDGILEFHGRVDNQVKVRGYRIELGEIEVAILQHDQVNEVHVTLIKENEENTLSCYYVSQHQLYEEELKVYLRSVLPSYMIPQYVVQLEKMPLNVNGKIDKQSLPDPRRVKNPITYSQELSKVQSRVQEVWREVLGHDVQITESFFDVGGHSLKAIQLVSRLNRAFPINLSIKEIFKLQTIEALSAEIERGAFQEIRNSKFIQTEKQHSLIEKAGEAPYYMAAPSQQNMYTLCNVVQGTHYNTPLLYEMLGEVNEEQLLYGLELLVRRHEALRTTFELKDHKVIQRIHEMLPIDFKKVDTDRPAEEVAKQCITSFSLEEGPLFKVRFIKHTGTKRQYLFTDFHHIVCDGITITILMNDLFSLLNGDRLEEIPLQYRDYSEWQNQQLNTNELNWHKEYYINLFQDGVPKTTLKTDFPRPLYPTFQGKTIPYTLSSSLTAKLKKVATETGTTLFMVLLATYNIFLAKHSHEEDLVVGTPFTGRNHPDSHEIAGMFVNTLPIRSQPRRDKGFKEYLFEVKELVFSGMEHSDYQFEQLVNDLNVTRDLSHNPLFDTMFTMQNFEVRSFNNARLEAQKMNFYGDTAHFDLLVYAYETQQEIQLEWEYSTDLFQENTIHRYISQFEKLLTEITDRLDSRISELQLLTTEEKNKVLYAFNNTAVGYDNEKSLLDVFSELVQSKPHITILKQDNQEITLEQLDELSNTVANYLLQRGVKEEQSIGIMMGNDVAMVVSALGIIKAGAAYVPLDFESPVQRINYIIEDCQLVYIFTNLTDMNPSISAETIQYQDILNSNASSAKVFPGRAPDSLACIMYTSGSTGQPKGVLVEDHNIISLVRDVEYIDFAAYQTLLMTGSFSFDASTFEIWGSLLNGLTLVLVDKSKLLDITEFSRVLAEYQVDLMWLTSPWFNQIISEDPSIFSHVQTLIVGGDLLSSVHIQSALKNNPQLQILNGYGPTENTTFSTIFAIDRNDVQQNIPIGKPITNSTGYVVDLHTQELLPIGQIGELWVGGEGVTRGYLNQTELTNTKYITNPFTGEGRVYKTGDLVSWNDDGILEFHGRVDNQVKVRGYRIELGEIEVAILQHDQVNEVHVTLIKENEENTLSCYYVSQHQLYEEELKVYLRSVLPSYMIPQYVVQLEKMPLNVNGKIDKQSLPDPRRVKNPITYSQELSKVQSRVQEVWREVLGHDVQITESFFDVGGHSLKAIQLVSRLNRAFPINLSIKEIFKLQTIEALSAEIERGAFQEVRNSLILQANKQPFYPISTAQKRIFILHEIYPDTRIYNVPLYYELNQPLDVEKFEHCINELIVKHEILRTSFVMINSQPVQVVHQDLRIAVKRSVIVGQHKREHFQEFIEVFDISAVPLFRVEYVEVDGSEFYILFDFHHIMMDGLSIQHFLNDLMQLYRFNTVATPSLQYKDYSMWLSTDEVQESISRQSSYWLNQFEGDIPLLELPTDKQRPALQSFEGHTIHFEVEEKLEKAVRTYASQSRSTLFTTLFSIFTVLLSKYTRQEDIVIGTTVSGRNHPDVDTMVGMFVNTLAIRTSPTKEKTMEDYLQEMNDQLIQSYANQDYPFEELVDQLHIQRDLSRNPLYNVMFSMSNVALQEHTTEGLILKPITAEYPFSKVDVTLAIHETDDKLSFSIEYATALYEADTIQRMGNHYIQLIQNVILSPARTRLKELKMITAAEEENLVFHYNDTAAPYSHHKLMHQLFEEKVLKIPQSIAVEGEFGQLTYQALNEQANQLAHLLRSRHETDSPYVAIMLDRGPDMIISVLGTLKAGFTYIPLDPKWPMERISYIVSSLAVKHMITEPHYVDSMSHVDMKSIICLTPASALGDHENLVDSKDIHPYSKVNPAPNQDTDSIAYVIFTSGSTGQPKGVEVKHKPVINLMEWMNSRFNINEGDKLLFVTSLCFDLSVYDIFGTLAAGGCIRIAVEHEVRDPDQLMNIIFNEGITVWDSAPAALQQLTSYFPEHPIPSHLRLVFLSGDWIPITLPTQLKTVFEQVQVISLGGATEATIWSNYYPVNEVKPQWKSIPYGKPIQNARYYILDSELHPCPTGVPGELYIGGECLATGYIQAPELTSERFVMDPFLKSSSHIMYRTGDLARWMKDGNMEFLGRIDHQVKIRGYRIELGEIEYHLLKHPMVKEAITMAKKDETGSNYLCAYYTTSQSNLDKELKSHLINKLPEYMVPSVFVEMEHFPVTVNGKLNRGALPEPKRVSVSDNYCEPTTEMEREIASIWEEVLKVEHIGTADNFFDIGGNSLLLVELHQMIDRIRPNKFKMVDIFAYPTIAEIASALEEENIQPNSDLAPSDIDSIFEQLENGQIDMEKALRELID